MNKHGHPRLRTLLKEIHKNAGEEVYCAQFSSIGSLGGSPEKWLTGQFLSSLAGGTKSG